MRLQRYRPNIRWFLLMVLIGFSVFFTPQRAEAIIVTRLDTFIACPQDTVVVYLNSSNMNDLSSLSLSLKYDTLALEYTGYQNLHPSFASSGLFLTNDIGGEVKAGWFSITPLNLGNIIIMEYVFVYLGGVGYLHWSDDLGACQYGNAQGASLPAQFKDGLIIANGTIIEQPEDTTVIQGNSATFDITTYGITNNYAWQEKSGSVWFDIVGGVIYSGANTEELTVNISPNSFNGYKYRCRTTGTCPAPNQYMFSDEAVLNITPNCQDAVAFSGNDTSICNYDSMVSLHATASNYLNVTWSGGDGSFGSPYDLITEYYPGPNDISTGMVTLSITASAMPPCSDSTHQFVLTIDSCFVNSPPFFLVPNDTFVVNGYVDYSSTICPPLIDPDNDPVDILTSYKPASYGILTGFGNGDSCFEYKPFHYYLGADTFGIIGCDTAGACDSTIVIVNTKLPPFNLPPVAMLNGAPTDSVSNIIMMSVAHQECFELLDLENDACDVKALLSAPMHGSISGLDDGDSCFTYTPDTAYTGPDTMSFSVCDTLNACNLVSYTVMILDLNIPYPPYASNDFFDLSESDSSWLDVLNNDFDINSNIDPSSVSLIAGPQHGMVLGIDSIGGMIHFKSLAYFYGTDTMVYRVCDSTQLCDTAKVYLNILPVFNGPVDDSVSIDEDAEAMIPVLDNDIFPFQVLDTSSFTILSPPSRGVAVFDVLSSMVQYVPFADLHGSDSFTYSVCDTLGMCGMASVNIEIAAVNDGPRVVSCNGVGFINDTAFNVLVCQDIPQDMCLVVYDPEGDSMLAMEVYLTSGSGAVITDPVIGDTCFNYAPSSMYSGLDTIMLILIDNGIPQARDTSIIIVHVVAAAYADAGSDSSICAGEAFPTASAKAVSYSDVQWTAIGSGVLFDPDSLSTIYYPSLQDITNGGFGLILSVTGRLGCAGATDTIQVSIMELPKPDLGNDTFLCADEHIVLDAGQGFVEYLWSTGEQTQSIYVDSSGTGFGMAQFSVTVTDLQSCRNSDIINIEIRDCLGFEEYGFKEHIMVYPVPADNVVTVSCPSCNFVSPEAVLFDIYGRLVRKADFDDSNNFHFDLGNLDDGMYIIHLLSGKKRFVSKILVQH